MENRSRDLWVKFGQVAAWLTASVLQFLSTPARLRLTEDSAPTTIRLVQFVLAVLVGLLFLAFNARCQRRHVRLWVIAAIVSLVAGLGSFGGYEYLKHRW